MEPAIWTTSVKLVARLEAPLEIDVHMPSRGPESPLLPSHQTTLTRGHGAIYWVFGSVCIVTIRDWVKGTAKTGELSILLLLHQLFSLLFLIW